MNSESTIIKSINIGYATETGNAYELALQTAISLKHKVQSLSEMNQRFVFHPDCLYILFISTTGQGDPPYAMRIFWKNLMSKYYKSLKNVKFCIYGLGDRSYGDNFNITSRKLRQRLLMLQAQQVISIGLGDEQDANGCFDQYFNNFYPTLHSYIEKTTVESSQFLEFKQIRGKPDIKNSTDYKQFKVVGQKLMSSVEGKYLYWVTLQLLNIETQIKLGDILEIYPHNNNQVVQQMRKYFTQNNLNDINISQQDLTQYLCKVANLSNVLNFTFFSQTTDKETQKTKANLAESIDNKLDENIQSLFKDKLQELWSDYSEYFNYIKKYRRNVRQVIADFSLKIQLGNFMQRLGSILTRKYSIAEINRQKNQISLLLKLQKFKVSSNRIVDGLCSHDLSLSPLGQIRLGRILPNGQFQLNFGYQKNIKIVMISLGTGVAPFLSILNQASRNNSNWQLALFHSDRYEKDCPLDCSTTQKLLKLKALKLFLTFTREKSPIQNRRLPEIVKQNLEIFDECRSGKIMICGGKQFCDLICRILELNLGFDIKKMRKQKIICMENW